MFVTARLLRSPNVQKLCMVYLTARSFSFWWMVSIRLIFYVLFTGNCHGRNLSWRIFSRPRAKTRVAFQCRWKSFNGGLNTIRSCHRPKSIRQLHHHQRNFWKVAVALLLPRQTCLRLSWIMGPKNLNQKSKLEKQFSVECKIFLWPKCVNWI